MARCPECGHENILDLPICEQCYAFMTQQPPNAPSTNEVVHPGLAPLLAQQAAHQTRPKVPHHHHLADDDIALYVEPIDIPIILQVPNELVLGRSVGSSPPGQPRLDLAPYDGLEAGVSRIHALIRRADHMEIVDLGSTNGTWLNGTRLAPYVAKLLRSGDQIRLARLWITIYYW